MRPNKPRGCSLEQSKFYPRAKKRELVVYTQKPWAPQWFWEKSFYRQNVGGVLQGTWLSSDWLVVTGLQSWNPAVRLKLPTSAWVAVEFCRKTKILPVWHWRGTGSLAHGCTVTSLLLLPCFHIPSCRGPAPVDPGNSKRGQRRRGSGNNCLIKR